MIVLHCKDGSQIKFKEAVKLVQQGLGIFYLLSYQDRQIAVVNLAPGDYLFRES